MKVNIIDLDYYGRGITKINGITTFVENALPGEVVEIEIINQKKKYIEAKVRKYIKTNENRCTFCENKCGGCHLDHISYKEQLLFKEKKVKDIINKFTKEKININNIISNPNPTNYRNKATFHINNKIGYYKNKTHEIIEINRCLLVHNKINYLLNRLKNQLDFINIYEIVIRASFFTNDSMVIFKVNGKVNEKDLIDKFKDEVSSIVLYDNMYKTLYGNDYIIDKIGDLNFIISPDSFFQVNTACAKQLYDEVLKYANPDKNDSILDLYCGTGTIGLYLSPFCKNVIGVEINKYAIMDANKNKKLNNINNVEFVCGDVGKLVENFETNFDTIIVDPPRAGLDKKTVDYLLNANSKKIVYVSCDPVTLARDLNLLKNKYDIKEITPVDMFSYTYHVECVCLLTLKSL